jgi:hypothetical protein
VKRSIALLVSAGVTALILVAVLAVSAPGTDPTTTPVNAAPATLSNDPAVLQQQIQQVYDLMQQREATYQQRLQEAYAQIQTLQSQPGESDDDEHEGAEREFAGVVETIDGNVWIIGGQAVWITEQSKIKRGIEVGSLVKVHARIQADGTLAAREIERKDD